LRLKILKKLRTANLNSEFTGSYKKKVYEIIAYATVSTHPFNALVKDASGHSARINLYGKESGKFANN